MKKSLDKEKEMTKFELCESLLVSITKEFEGIEERQYTAEEKKYIDFFILTNINETIIKLFGKNEIVR